MQAKKIGVEKISLGGKDVEAVKVYYSATGPGEKFYKRIYYFRKADGIFPRKLDPKGEVSSADLTSER